MVVKTEVCAFSGLKIYPGKGSRFVRVDSRMFLFIDAKCAASYHMKRNPRKLCWTQFYRKLHKKGAQEETSKRRKNRSVKIQRGFVGASLDIIKAKRTQKPEDRAAARDAAIKDAKAKSKATAEKKKAEAKKAVPKGGKSAAPAPKAPNRGGKGR
eukprot:JP437661.1.p2 GENE.JP437661.1~~JP437661.1.p2  ORF type:complete len:155 (-),score=57.51 JP437661.1:72-536(-)